MRSRFQLWARAGYADLVDPRQPILIVLSLILIGSFTLTHAQAQTLRTYVSGTGNDTNPCTISAPCRTFQAAITLTSPGGEIQSLDSADYGHVTITQPVTVIGAHGVAGVLATNVSGVTINAGPNDMINLSGLEIDGAGSGASGILFNSGGVLNVDDSLIRGFTNGISVSATNPNSFSISNTVVVNNSVGLSVQSSATSTGVLSGVQLVNNATGAAETGAGSSAQATLIIQNSVVANNSAVGLLSNGFSTINVSNTTVANNGVGVEAQGQNAALQLTGSTVTGNGAGWVATNSGVVHSSGANSISGNTSGNSAPPAGPISTPSPSTTPPSTVSVNVASLPLGTVAANSLSPTCFTNPTGTVFANSNWTSASTQYLAAPSAQQFIIRTLAACSTRDVEVTTWTRNGYVYARLDSTGKAIYFLHNGETANGSLEIGIVTGLDETAYPGGTYYPLYQNNNLVGTVPGYNKSNTTGASFTFGVSGFDIYARFNGVEFTRFKEYRQMNGGAVALKANPGYGFRAIKVSPLTTQYLYSDYANNKIDLRDWNVRSTQTKGTIAGGSNSLTIAAPQNFQVGDWVIVEIGAEAGAGARGTIGVGGQWPTRYYADAAAMNADTSQTPYTYAWTQNDGVVYQWGGLFPTWLSSTTFNTGDQVQNLGVNYRSLINNNISNTPASSPSAWQVIGTGGTWVAQSSTLNYYTAKAIPLSLHGRISAISADGKTLTLLQADGVTAANAAVTATNANVFLDNQPYVNYLTGPQNGASFYADLTPITPTNMTIIFPTGTFAGSGQIQYQAQSGWTIKGQGQANTTLLAPKGVYSLHLYGAGVTGYTFSDFTLQGNFGTEKYGLAFPGWTYVPGGMAMTGPWAGSPNNNPGDRSVITQTLIPQGSAYPSGIGIDGGGIIGNVNATVQDITVNDVSQKAVGVSYANNVWAYRVTNNEHSVNQIYVQWQFQWANSNNGGCVDCKMNSVALRAGFESFGSSGHQFLRPVSVNGAFSENTANSWVIQDATLTVTDNHTGNLPPAWDKNNPLVNINSNIGGYDVAAGGTISNMVINVQGYVDSANDVPVGINVNASNPNITITGGRYTGPNYASPSTLAGPQGIRSTGTNTQVSGFTTCGTVIPNGTVNIANIGVFNGAVNNSKANVIVTPAGSGNTSAPTPCP
jgi:hypothetical protein